MMPNPIILNNVFPNASYNMGNNLYHETINLFKSDNGKYYIHLNANGTYKGAEPVDVLNITRADNGLYQILSFAKNCTIVNGAEITARDKGEERYNKQINKIQYGGVFVEKYFEENVTMGKSPEKDLFVTFICDTIEEPKKNIYITFDNFKNKNNLNLNSFEISNKTKFSSPCRINLKDPNDPNVVGLNTFLKGITWNAVGTYDERVKELKEKFLIAEENYFSLLGVEKQELPYSNAIVKILKFKKDGVSSFLSELLGINVLGKNNFTEELRREEKNVDILFKDFTNKRIVIIENKIDAGITLPNSTTTSLKKQAENIFIDVFGVKPNSSDKRWTTIVTCLKSEKTNQPSQLSKYYIYALCWALKSGWSSKEINENIHCFFLCPEYHKHMYATNTAKMLPYAFSNKYRLITYKDLFEIFQKVFPENDLSLTPHQNFIVKDFLNAISFLAKDRDDTIEIKMIRKFIERHDEIASKSYSYTRRIAIAKKLSKRRNEHEKRNRRLGKNNHLRNLDRRTCRQGRIL